MEYFVEQLINGLNLGSIYALVAVGLTVVYGILRLINFAHGDLLMLGAYVALAAVGGAVLPLGAAVLLPIVVVGAIGLVVERIGFRPLRGAPEVAMLVTSLAISSLIENGMTMSLSAQPRSFHLPPGTVDRYSLGAVGFSTVEVATVVLTFVVMGMLMWFVRGTRLGIAMRACSENLRAARLMGININRVVATAFVLGGSLAGVAGFMYASKFNIVDPFMGFVPGLKGFVAAVIGGIGVIPGAVLGGFVLGLAEVMFVGFIPADLSAYRDAFVFGILLVILLVRPNGILGSPTEVRA